MNQKQSGEDGEAMNDMDNSLWRFTNIIQTGKNRWSKLAVKFWRVPGDIKNHRYEICKQCDYFISVSTQCKKCLCAMGLKTWLGGFKCPQGKWGAEEPPEQGKEPG